VACSSGGRYFRLWYFRLSVSFSLLRQPLPTPLRPAAQQRNLPVSTLWFSQNPILPPSRAVSLSTESQRLLKRWEKRMRSNFLNVALFYPVSDFSISSHFLRENLLSRGDFGHCFHKRAEFLAEAAHHTKACKSIPNPKRTA